MTNAARSNLASRLLTAAIAGPLLLLLLFAGSAEAWFWLVWAAAALASYELAAMTHPTDRVARIALTATTLCVSWLLYHHTDSAPALLGILLGVPIVGLMVTLWRVGNLESAALRASASIACPLYVGGLLTCLALLRRDAGGLGSYYVLLALMLSWLADTGGYFAGRYLGNRFPTKLHPRVSPKKTRVGFVGSLVGASASVLIAWAWYLPHVPLWKLLALGWVAGSLGQLGDLAESMIKRSTGIKDSGTLIPGHGGVLDRVDALLIVSPVLYLFSQWSQ